jgi:D-xylose transport system substrate-binding protein
MSTTQGKRVATGRLSRGGWISLGLASAMALAVPLFGTGIAGADKAVAHTSSSAKGTVYFMIPDTTPSRYIAQDGPDFVAAIKALAPGITVKTVNAGGNQTTQQTQGEAAIAAGAKALVVVAADPPLSGGLLAYAKKHNVPVIGYENVPEDGPMYAQVEFNPKEAGVLQGKYFSQEVTSGALGKYPVTLARIYGNDGDVYNTQMQIGQNEYIDPLVKSGKVKVVCSAYTPNWAETGAVTEMAQCLSAQNDKVRAVLSVYDGETQGAIVALGNAHLTAGSGPKDVAVFGGQNPTTIGLDYVLTGNQEDDVIKPFIYEAQAAAQLAVAAVEGKAPPAGMINAKVNAGNNNEVPTDFLNEAYVTAGANAAAEINKYVVETKTFTWAQICVGSVTSSAGCKKYDAKG